jgi:phage anti-repressor protein
MDTNHHSTDLIPFATRQIGNESVNTVNARDLYAYLGIAKQYGNWLKVQLKRAHLLENIDYEVFTLQGKNPLGGRPAQEHHLSFDAAKHVAMMSSATKGREVRNWFIQKEKELTALQQSSSTPTLAPLAAADHALEVYERFGKFFNAPLHLVQQELVKYITREIGLDLMPLLSGAPAQENIQPEEEMLEPTELAKQLNVKSGKAMNLLLAQIGWQIQQIGGVWRPTPAGELYAIRHAWTSEHSTKTGYN